MSLPAPGTLAPGARSTVSAPAALLAESGVSVMDVVTTPALLALAVLVVLVLTGAVLALWALWRTRPRAR